MPRVKKVQTDFAPPEAEAVLADVAAPAAVAEPAAPLEPPCRMDEFPAPAKLVVVMEQGGEKKVMLLWADRFHPVGKDDLAWKLPVGAKIQRLPETFVAVQLDRPELEPMYGTSARDLILAFPTYIA